MKPFEPTSGRHTDNKTMSPADNTRGQPQNPGAGAGNKDNQKTGIKNPQQQPGKPAGGRDDNKTGGKY